MGKESSNSSTLKKLLSAKTIKFIPGICLLVNALTGPSIPFTTSLFQEAGWLPTVTMFGIFTVLAVICGLLIVEAMQSIPGNKHFQGTVEFATLVNFYFGPKSHIAAQVCLYGAIQANAIQSIVLSAQAFGRTCGIAMRFDSKAFMCVTSADLSASPFGDTLMFCTIGLIIVLILALPLGLLDLENNINLQLAWFVISIGIFLQWVVTAIMFTYTQEYIDNPVQLTAVASKIDSLAGTIMLSMAFAFVIPSWINIKKKDVDIESSLWYSGLITLLMYLIIGLVPALCYPDDTAETNGNILITLMKLGIPQSLTKITVYLFPIIMLLPSIPVSCIVSFDNIAQSEVCSRRTSAVLAFIFPWICSIPLQTGGILNDFQNYASLIFVSTGTSQYYLSTANFIVPIMIYLKCVTFREAYNRDRSILSEKQRKILKLVHLNSKPILQWVDYLSSVNEKEGRPPVPRVMVQSPTPVVNALEAKVDTLISMSSVVIFSKSICPYCEKAKGILTAKDIDYFVIELDGHEDGADIQSILARKTGQSTVPSGCSELLGMESRGELSKASIEAGMPSPPQYFSAADSIDEDFTPQDDSIVTILRDDIPDHIQDDLEHELRLKEIEKGDSPIEIVLDGNLESNRLSKLALGYTNTSTSSINFEKLEEKFGPEFAKQYSLPVESKFKGKSFRSFPPWVNRIVSTRVIALVTMFLIVVVCIGNIALLIKGLVEGDGDGMDGRE